MKVYPYQITDYLKEKENMFRVVHQIYSTVEVNQKKIFLFNLPSDSNLGDHAQTVCIRKFLKEKFQKYCLYEFPTFTKCTFNDVMAAFNGLKWLVTEDDILVFHSGYHINDIYCNEFFSMCPTAMVQLIILRMFKKNRIIYFPQTINMNEENMKAYANELNSNLNVTFLCRDEVSYNLASRYFIPQTIYILPDIVTTLIGRYHINVTHRNKRKVYVALRNQQQKESAISEDKKNQLLSVLKKNNYEVVQGSTSIDEPYEIIRKMPDIFVNEKIEEISQYDLVVTDLYHGTIFSIIANTPVLVLPSTDYKVKSGISFFRKYSQFDDRVYYRDNFMDSMKLLEELSKKKLTLGDAILPYFYEQYQSILSDMDKK